MKFYVASKFKNYPAVQDAVRRLRREGHSITFDWANNDTEFVDGVLYQTGEELTPRQQTDFALLDLQGAKDADAVLLLYVDQMRGAYIEVGAALAMGRIVYVIGEDIPFTIFWFHPNVRRFDHVDEFFWHLNAVGA